MDIDEYESMADEFVETDEKQNSVLHKAALELDKDRRDELESVLKDRLKELREARKLVDDIETEIEDIVEDPDSYV